MMTHYAADGPARPGWWGGGVGGGGSGLHPGVGPPPAPAPCPECLLPQPPGSLRAPHSPDTHFLGVEVGLRAPSFP